MYVGSSVCDCGKRIFSMFMALCIIYYTVSCFVHFWFCRKRVLCGSGNAEMLECSVQVWCVFLVFSLTCILLADVR